MSASLAHPCPRCGVPADRMCVNLETGGVNTNRHSQRAALDRVQVVAVNEALQSPTIEDSGNATVAPALACPWCGVDIRQAPTGRPRVFCQTAHRVAMHRWTKAWDSIQVGLDGVGRCYCCNRRGKVTRTMTTLDDEAPFCLECARTCNPDAGVMLPKDESGPTWNRRSPCVTDWGWYAVPSGIGWNKAKPFTRRRAT